MSALQGVWRGGVGFLGVVGTVGLLSIAISSQVKPQTMAQRQLDGVVEGADGSPVGGAVVELHGWSGGTLASAVTGADGRFSFLVGQAEHYQLQLDAGGAVSTTDVDGSTSRSLTLRTDTYTAPSSSAHRTPPTVSLNDLEAPARAKSKFNQAQKAIQKSDFKKAWDLVNQAISAAPNWGRAYLLRGVLSMQLHNYAPAKSDFDTAVQQDPKNAMALTELGKLYATTGDATLSELYLHRALQIEPVLWPTYFEMADLDLHRGKFSEAYTMAEAAVNSNPPAPSAARFVAAEAAFHLQRWPEARLEYQAFITEAGKTPSLANAVGVAQSQLAKLQATAAVVDHP
ncbi:MAG TPA: tetratricopeptide repeat protein [Terriglobales bacterium]|nr:tetratricopeptide repeat protein [Terriglobales bacterium]